MIFFYVAKIDGFVKSQKLYFEPQYTDILLVSYASCCAENFSG
jgi:hypothetical protein